MFIKGSKHIPLNFKFYKTRDEFRLGKYGPGFRYKLDFARELLDEAIEQKIDFSYVAFDSWYSSADFIEFIARENRESITEIRPDRKILFKHPAERKAIRLRQDELVKPVKIYFRHKARVIRCKDALPPVYSFQTRLKNSSLPIRAFNKWPDDDPKSIHILIADDLKPAYKKVVGIYTRRRGIERAFRELKDSFYFGRYQARHKEKITPACRQTGVTGCYVLLYSASFTGLGLTDAWLKF